MCTEVTLLMVSCGPRSILCGLGWDAAHPLRPWIQSTRQEKPGGYVYTCFSWCGFWLGWLEPADQL